MLYDKKCIKSMKLPCQSSYKEANKYPINFIFMLVMTRSEREPLLYGSLKIVMVRDNKRTTVDIRW